MGIMVEVLCKKHLVVIRQIIIGKKGDNKMAYYFRVNLVVIVILLTTSSFGGAELMNPDVLSQSRIKKISFKQILNDIKKTLPKELRKCSIVVTDIAFLQREYKYPNIAEEWTIDVCQEKKVYFIADESPKGKYYTVTPGGKRLNKEKEIWNAVKNDDDDGEWRATLFYINKIEAMSQRE